MSNPAPWRSLAGATIIALAATLGGCFVERSFPADERRIVRVHPGDTSPAPGATVRDWTAHAHRRFLPLLPKDAQNGVTSDSFAAAGRPIDIYARLHVNRANVDSLLCNLHGLEQSAQVVSPEPPKNKPTPDWPGFTNVEIEMADGGVLCGRLAPPTAHDLGKSYVVLTHGLFGSMYGVDVQNHIVALRNAGHHVLSLEMRGHGETAVKHPQDMITFGAAEGPDLIAVAHRLKAHWGAKRVALVSFSLTGYESLLAAWLDSGGMDELDRAGSRLLAGRERPAAEPAYNGGMFIVSPPVNFIETAESFDREYNILTGPVKATFQKKCQARLAERKGDTPTYRMWDFARAEFLRAPLAKRYGGNAEAFTNDFMPYVDLQRDNWNVGRSRMEKVRAPVLILTSANDPLGTAHGVVHLLAGVKSPNVAAVVLPQGGHMGFPAVSADYYYSLMLNFLDPAAGPRAK